MFHKHLALSLLLLLSCNEDKTENPLPSDGFDRGALASSLGENVVLPTLKAAKDKSLLLSSALARFRNGETTQEAALMECQGLWRDVQSSWQMAEAMQVGPAALNATMGEGLRDEIYSWPTQSPCRLDQTLVENRFDAPGFLDEALVSIYGLDALEYLLFAEGPQNACASSHIINTSGTWSLLSAEDILERRLNYAHVVSMKLNRDLTSLVEAWEKPGGFLEALKNAGKSGTAFATAQAAVDEFFRAMYYLDLKVKSKLADPAGLSSVCTASICPELAESRFSKHSAQNVVANIRGFQALFSGELDSGTDRIGFYEFLKARGAEALAEDMKSRIETAVASAEAMSPSLEDDIQQDGARVKAALEAVNRVTNVLKSQFVSVLNLRVPEEGASDND